MQRRNIPHTDLHPSLLAYGNFVFGTNWWGDFTDDDAVRLQNHAVDRGVNFFDTAPAYGNYRAERLLAPTIRYAGRDNLVISTKFGYDLESDPGEEGSHRERAQNFRPDHVRRELEESLTRMGIDHLDLYQAHNVKLAHYSDELFALMHDLVDEGKIRAWGVALGPAIGWREEGHDALQRGAHTVQTVFNLYEQDLGRELCEAVTHAGRGAVISRVPSNSGILDEEFTSPDFRFPPHDHRKYRDRAWLVYGLKKNEILRPIAADLGLTIQQLALRWLASQPGLVSIEPNLLSEDSIDAHAQALDGSTLPDDVLAECRRLYATDFGLGDAAHPCDFKSSVTKSGRLRAGYAPPAFA